MELISISTGSWFPRTKLHLKEFYNFLKDGTSHLPLDPERLRMLHSQLKPLDVQYRGGTFDKVTASFEGDISLTYHEDGLLLLEIVPTADPRDAIDALRDFYGNRLTGTLGYLYSIGTPVVSYNIPHVGHRPIVIHAKGVTDDSARIFCAEMDQHVHFIARHTDRTVYFSKGIILIGDDSSGAGTTRIVIDHLVLFREYEHKLRHYLELHRNLWEAIAAIQERKSIPAAELSGIRDALVDHKRDLAVIRSRIDQMRAYIGERKAAIDALGIEEDMRAVEAYRFGKLDASTVYIARLWEMLDEYLSSTIELTGFLSQENLQKEIGVQQFIFLVGSVSGIIALGSISGAFISYQAGGKEMVAQLNSFDLMTLLRFGGTAIGASIIVFYVIGPLVKVLNRISPERLIGGFGKKTEEIGNPNSRKDIDIS